MKRYNLTLARNAANLEHILPKSYTSATGLPLCRRKLHINSSLWPAHRSPTSLSGSRKFSTEPVESQTVENKEENERDRLSSLPSSQLPHVTMRSDKSGLLKQAPVLALKLNPLAQIMSPLDRPCRVVVICPDSLNAELDHVMSIVEKIVYGASFESFNANDQYESSKSSDWDPSLRSLAVATFLQAPILSLSLLSLTPYQLAEIVMKGYVYREKGRHKSIIKVKRKKLQAMIAQTLALHGVRVSVFVDATPVDFSTHFEFDLEEKTHFLQTLDQMAHGVMLGVVDSSLMENILRVSNEGPVTVSEIQIRESTRLRHAKRMLKEGAISHDDYARLLHHAASLHAVSQATHEKSLPTVDTDTPDSLENMEDKDDENESDFEQSDESEDDSYLSKRTKKQASARNSIDDDENLDPHERMNDFDDDFDDQTETGDESFLQAELAVYQNQQGETGDQTDAITTQRTGFGSLSETLDALSSIGVPGASFGPVIDVDFVTGTVRTKRLLGKFGPKSPLIQSVLGQANARNARPGNEKEQRMHVSRARSKAHHGFWDTMDHEDERGVSTSYDSDGTRTQRSRGTPLRLRAEILTPTEQAQKQADKEAKRKIKEEEARVKAMELLESLPRIRMLDLTGGFGTDTFIVLSSAKVRDRMEVTMLERNPLMFLLLADGVRRARQTMPPHLIAERLSAAEKSTILAYDPKNGSIPMRSQTSSSPVLKKSLFLRENDLDTLTSETSTEYEKWQAHVRMTAEQALKRFLHGVAIDGTGLHQSDVADIAKKIAVRHADSVDFLVREALVSSIETTVASLSEQFTSSQDTKEKKQIIDQLRQLRSDQKKLSTLGAQEALEYAATSGIASSKELIQLNNAQDQARSVAVPAIAPNKRHYDVIYADPFYPSKRSGKTAKAKAAMRNTKLMGTAKLFRNIEEEYDGYLSRSKKYASDPTFGQTLLNPDHVIIANGETISLNDKRVEKPIISFRDEPINTKLLLNLARISATTRVVLKRPKHAEKHGSSNLAGRFVDRKTRFDVFAPATGKRDAFFASEDASAWIRGELKGQTTLEIEKMQAIEKQAVESKKSVERKQRIHKKWK